MGNLSGRSRFHNVKEAFSSEKLPGNFVEEANIAKGLLNIFSENCRMLVRKDSRRIVKCLEFIRTKKHPKTAVIYYQRKSYFCNT